MEWAVKRLLVLSLFSISGLLGMMGSSTSMESDEPRQFKIESKDGSALLVPEYVVDKFVHLKEQKELFTGGSEGRAIYSGIEKEALEDLIKFAQLESGLPALRAIRDIDDTRLLAVLSAANILDFKDLSLFTNEVAFRLDELSLADVLALPEDVQELVLEKWFKYPENKDRMQAAGCPIDWILEKSLDGNISSVAMSADGNRIVFGNELEDLNIYDFVDGQWQLQLGIYFDHYYHISSVGISADGNRIVLGGDFGNIRIYDFIDGGWKLKFLDNFSSINLVPISNVVAISADGNRVVSGDYSKNLGIYDLMYGDWKLSKSFGLAGSIYSVAISADGNRIVSGDESGRLNIYDRIDGAWELRVSFSGEPANPIYSVAISADGNRVVFGGERGRLNIYDHIDGKWELKKISSVVRFVTSLAISADGNRVISADDGKGISIYNFSDGGWNLEKFFDFIGPYRVAMSASGNKVALVHGDGVSFYGLPNPENYKLTLPVVYAIARNRLTDDERGMLVDEIDFDHLHEKIREHLKSKGIEKI